MVIINFPLAQSIVSSIFSRERPQRLERRVSINGTTPFRLPIFVMIGLLVGVPHVFCVQRPADPEWHELSRELVTSHVEWGVPLDGGPLRVFSMEDRKQHRDLVELAQRVDLDYRFLHLYTFGFGYGAGTGWISRFVGDSPEERLALFRENMASSPEVIILGAQTMFRVLPPEVVYKILKYVHDGGGLCIVNRYPSTGDGAPIRYSSEREDIVRLLDAKDSPAQPAREKPEWLFAGVPFSRLGGWRHIPSRKDFEGRVKLLKFGDGRIVELSRLLPYQGSRVGGMFTPPLPKTPTRNNIPYPTDRIENPPVEDEYYYAFAGKCLRWAANRPPQVRLRDLTLRVDGENVADESIERGRLANVCAVLDWEGERGTGEWGVRRVIRRGVGTGEVLDKSDFPLTSSPMEIPLASSLPQGPCFVDVQILRDGKVVDWGSLGFDLTGRAGIESIKARPKSIQPGDAVTSTIKLKRPLETGETLRCRAWGNDRRLLAESMLTPNKGATTAQWRYEHVDTIGRMLEMEVALLRNGRVVDDACELVIVRLPFGADDEWHFVPSAGTEPTPLGRVVGQLLETSGVTHVQRAVRGYYPPYHKSEIPLRRAARADIRHNLRPYYDIFNYNARPQQDNTCKRCFNDPKVRSEAQQQVQRFARVLRDFGAAYNIGHECGYSDLKDVCMCEHCNARFADYLRDKYHSLDALNNAWGTTLEQWEDAKPVDFKTAKSTRQFTRWVDFKKHMASEWIAWNRTLIRWIKEEDPDARVGTMYISELENMVPYFRLFDITASVPPRHPIMGRYPDGDFARSLDAPGMLKGGHCAWAWQRDRGEDQKFHFWDMFMAGARTGEIHQANIGSHEGYIAPDGRWYSFMKEWFEEFEFISQGLDKLIFTSRRAPPAVGILYSENSRYGARVLELPYTHYGCHRALRDPCWEASVANVLVPEQDLDNGSEDLSRFQVLMLPSVVSLSNKTASVIRKFAERGGVVLADSRPGLLTEDGAKRSQGCLDDLFNPESVTDLQKHDPTVHAYGNGGGVLVNMPAVRSEFAPQNKELLKTALNQAFQYANVKPSFQTDAFRWAHYLDGPAEYALLVNRTTKDCSFAFSREGHLYDAREGRYLGKEKEGHLALNKDEGRLVSSLPYKLRSVSATGPTRVNKGEQPRFALRALREQPGPIGRHVFSTRLFNPQGQEVMPYRQDVAGDNGRAYVTVPLCLNDPEGTWTLRA